MGAVTISLIEGAGSLYPAPTPNADESFGDPFPGDGFAGDGFTEVFAELGATEEQAAFVQSRIESYIRHRWGERAFEAIVEGPGEWTPPLMPVTVSAIEQWIDESWTAVTAQRTPLGYLFGAGSFRVTGTAGNEEAVPPAVAEAARRLHAYYVKADEIQQDVAGGTLSEFKIGPLEKRVEVSPSFIARALQNSGAADLLRP